MIDPRFNLGTWKDAATRKTQVDVYHKSHNPLLGIIIQVTDTFTAVVKMPVRQRVFEQVARRVMQRK